MPILLSSTVRRALGAAAFVAWIAVSVWIFSANNSSSNLIKKKKKKELEVIDSDLVKQEVVETDKVQRQAERKVSKEVKFEDEVVKMEVLVASSEDLEPSSVHLEGCKDEEEVLSEVIDIDDDDDDKPASRSWTELVEEELEETKELEKSLASQLTTLTQPQNMPSDSRKSTSSDSGVVSPAENADARQLMEKPQKHQKQQLDKKDDVDHHIRKHNSRTISGGSSKSSTKGCANPPSCNSSDSGQGTELLDGVRFTFHFNVPSELTGKLIGAQGSNIDMIRRSTQCEVSVLRPHEYEAAVNASFCSDLAKFTRHYIRKHLLQGPEPPKAYNETQICVIEGTRTAIDRCLEYLRDMFPLESYPQFTLEQINRPMTSSTSNGDSVYDQNIYQQLMLAQNALHDATVSAVISAGHIFVQQTSHPTFLALPRLDVCMNNVYNKTTTPEVDRNEINVGLVCVAPCDRKWYRVQVVFFDAVSDMCDVKFLDYGGYSTIEAKELRKIRTDFLKLPFQAIECYLANVVPSNSTDWTFDDGVVLQELVTQENQVIACRMLGVAEDYIPLIHLYSTDMEGNTKLINRELVEKGAASWVELASTTVSVSV